MAILANYKKNVIIHKEDNLLNFCKIFVFFAQEISSKFLYSLGENSYESSTLKSTKHVTIPTELHTQKGHSFWQLHQKPTRCMIN